MKISALLKFQTRLLRRRNKAQRAYSKRPYDTMDHTRSRLDAEVATLDKVLDDLDRLIAANHDRFCEQTRPFRTRPAVSWPGGKSRILDAILPLIPKHECYVEPFAGGLAVFLAKPRSQNEVINDVHTDLITFYRCVRFHRDELLTELEFVLNSRQEFHDFRAQPGLTDIQRAARWYTRNKIGFGGDADSFGVRVSRVSSRVNRMETIRQLNLRLDTATIEHLDWQRCMDLYDRPTTFFFLDPPYTDCAKVSYDSWQESDVISLRQKLDRLQGKWLLTLNDSSAIRSIFHDCKLTAISRALGVTNKAGRATVYKELIIAPK